MRRPDSLQVVTAVFVLVLLTVLATVVVLAMRSDRLSDRRPGVASPSLTTLRQSTSPGSGR